MLKKDGADEIYLEYESGINENRPELVKILNRIREGDTLMATEVSRITRSTRHLCEIMDIAVRKKIKLVIGSLVFDCSKNDPLTEAMIKIAGVFSELERKMTIYRVKIGLVNAKAKGIRLGRPKMTVEQIPSDVLDYFDLYEDGRISKMAYARLCGVSVPTIYRYIRLLTDAETTKKTT